MNTKEFNERKDVCIENVAEERLYDDADSVIEDYISWFRERKLTKEKAEPVLRNIKVYKKEEYFLSYGRIISSIREELEDLGYDEFEFGDIEDSIDSKKLAGFVDDFNKHFCYYQAGEQIDTLDIYDEVMEEVLEPADLSNESAFAVYLKLGYDDVMDFKTFCYTKLGRKDLEDE